MSKKFLSNQRLLQFQALQHCLIPRSQKFNDVQKQDSIKLVNDFVGKMPAATQRKLSLFFKVINLISVATGSHLFQNLSSEKRTKVMHLFFDSPVGLLRKGFWGVSTLVKLSVFGQPSLYTDIGYHKKDITYV